MEQPDRVLSTVPRDRLDRRAFLRRSGVGALALTAGPAALARAAGAPPKQVNIATYGGVVAQGLQKYFGDPFTKRTGITINFGSNASLALAKLQSTSGGPAQWDIIELTGGEVQAAARDKLIVPYDYGIIDTTHMPPVYREPYGAKFTLYLFVMAWDRRKIPDDKAPKNWAEFWDVQKFPGKRSLDANISDGSVLEAALLADGVTPDKLYPLDVERALKSLERLGPAHIIWHNTNAEPIQQLGSGEVPLASVFDGRVILADRAGASLGFTPDYGGVSGDYLCVAASSANKREAFQILSYILSNTAADAEYIELTTYAMPNSAVLPLLPKKIVDILPTNPSLRDKVFIKNDAWWAANLEKTTTRFKEWQLTQ